MLQATILSCYMAYQAAQFTELWLLSGLATRMCTPLGLNHLAPVRPLLHPAPTVLTDHSGSVGLCDGCEWAYAGRLAEENPQYAQRHHALATAQGYVAGGVQ